MIYLVCTIYLVKIYIFYDTKLMGCVKETECDMIVSYTTRNNSTAADYPEIYTVYCVNLAMWNSQLSKIDGQVPVYRVSS
jgi:hypothetical protein